MKFHEESLDIKTTKKLEVIDVTERVEDILRRNDVTRRLVNLCTIHPTAYLSINEHGEGIWEDFLTSLTRVVPAEGEYQHEQNSYAHIMSTIIKPNVSILIIKGGMKLGQWPSILLIEFAGPRMREVYVTVVVE